MSDNGQVLDDSEMSEFYNEATELLDESEKHLLLIDRGEPFHTNYDAIFRVLHSLKGAAGMLGLTSLQSHMHQLETHFQSTKSIGKMSKPQCTYFLDGIDTARLILDNKPTNFTYAFPSGGELPTIPASSTPATPTPAPISATTVTPTKTASTTMGLIYVVDDEPEICEILSDILTTSGFQVKKFGSAKGMLEEFEAKSPDLILSDLNMPEISGMELLEKVNAENPEIPVVLISGHIGKEGVIQALERGVFGVIEKPFSNSYVLSIAQSAVKRHKISILLNRSINLIMYQFSDLDKFLKETGRDDIRKTLQLELNNLLEARRELKQLSLKKPEPKS